MMTMLKELPSTLLQPRPIVKVANVAAASGWKPMCWETHRSGRLTTIHEWEIMSVEGEMLQNGRDQMSYIESIALCRH